MDPEILTLAKGTMVLGTTLGILLYNGASIDQDICEARILKYCLENNLDFNGTSLCNDILEMPSSSGYCSSLFFEEFLDQRLPLDTYNYSDISMLCIDLLTR